MTLFHVCVYVYCVSFSCLLCIISCVIFIIVYHFRVYYDSFSCINFMFTLYHFHVYFVSCCIISIVTLYHFPSLYLSFSFFFPFFFSFPSLLFSSSLTPQKGQTCSTASRKRLRTAHHCLCQPQKDCGSSWKVIGENGVQYGNFARWKDTRSAVRFRAFLSFL